MGTNSPLTSFGYYVRLYTLHEIERPADMILLSVRLHTLRYSFAPLRSLPLDDAYAADPREGVELVRATVLPRLHTLLDSGDPFRELRLVGEQEALWRRYAAERGLPADPRRIPVIHAPIQARRLPARSTVSQRLARVQQALELVRTAADTAATLAAGWQNWQVGRERRKLLETQRSLLQDAIQAQMTGQGRALDRALEGDFVRGYLAEHAGDSAYQAVFGDDELAGDSAQQAADT